MHVSRCRRETTSACLSLQSTPLSQLRTEPSFSPSYANMVVSGLGLDEIHDIRTVSCLIISFLGNADVGSEDIIMKSCRGTNPVLVCTGITSE